MKPSWNDAPEWANWLAMDDNGNWYWYSAEPSYDFGDGLWKDGGESDIASCPISAESSLERRP
jgi:hypothetical protein